MNKSNLIQELICSINHYVIKFHGMLLLLKYLEVDLICLFVCFFSAPRTDIILKTRSTLWLG